MVVNSRQSLADYCLRKLGDPTIRINIAPEQIDDRLDEALGYYNEFVSDAVQRTYWTHVVTSDDLTNHWIPSDEIPGLQSIISVIYTPQSTFSMFDIRYQLFVQDVLNFRSGSVQNYQIIMQHLSLLQFMFDVNPTVNFNKKVDQVFLNLDWTIPQVGDFLIFEVDAIINPEDWPKVYNDRWLRDYVYALFKQQWAENLSKYKDVQLPSGKPLNAERMLTEAEKLIEKLQKEAQEVYQGPPNLSWVKIFVTKYQVMIVYLIENKINGKKYVGITRGSLSKRYKTHIRRAFCTGKTKKYLLNLAMAKYGPDNFELTEIDSAETLNELNEKEIYWIKQHNSHFKEGFGYNMTFGGGGVLRGPMTEEQKKKISEANKKMVFTEEHKAKISAAKMGIKRPNFHLPKDHPIFSSEIRKANADKLRGRKRKDYIFDPNHPYSEQSKAKRRKTWEDPLKKAICSAKFKEVLANPEVKEKMRKAKLGKKRFYRDDGTFYLAFPVENLPEIPVCSIK